MPLYEGRSSVGSQEGKAAVVIDIGTAYTKLGFAGEFSPRFIIPTEVPTKQLGGVSGGGEKLHDYKDSLELKTKLKDFIHAIYFKYLLVNPKGRRLLVVESILTPTEFKETLALVVFDHFDIPSLCFAPSHLLAIYTLGIETALVIDAGYKETVALPIVEGIPVLNLWEAVPLAGKAIHAHIERQLLGSATVNANSLHPGRQKPLSDVIGGDEIPETILEDIKVRTCFVTEFSRGQKIQQSAAMTESQRDSHINVVPPPDVDYPLEDGENILQVDGFIREGSAEILWEIDNEEKSVATIVLDIICKAGVDMRCPLAENLLVIGGTASLLGFRHRLLAELNYLADHHPRYSKLITKKSFKVHDAPAKPNYVAWLGGAIFGALDAMVTRSIPRDAYRQHRIIPDWNRPSGENPYKDIVAPSILGGGIGLLDSRGSSSSSSSSLTRLRTSTATTSASLTSSSSTMSAAISASRNARKGSTSSGARSGSPASVTKMDTS